MKRGILLSIVVAVLILVMIAVIWIVVILHGTTETERSMLYVLSPDVTMAAFVHTQEKYGLPLPGPEPPRRIRCDAVLKLGTFGSATSIDVLPVSFGQSGDASSYYDYLWRSDSQVLVVRAGRNLWLVDAQSGGIDQLTKLAGDACVTTFAWTDAGQIVYVVRKDPMMAGLDPSMVMMVDDASELEMYQINAAANATAHSIYVDQFTRSKFAFRNAVWRSDELSPNGRYLIYGRAASLRCVDLQTGQISQELDITGDVSGVWWSPDERYCLVYIMRYERPDGAALWEGNFVDQFFLFDLTSDSVTEITDRLRQLNGNDNNTPRPDLGRAVWGADSTWFAVFGTVERPDALPGQGGYIAKDWICSVEPWTTVCVSDAIHDQTWGVWPAPKGNGFWVRVGSYETGTQLRAGQLSPDAQGQLVVEMFNTVLPKSLSDGQFTWLMDGRQVIIFGDWPDYQMINVNP